MVCTLHRLQCKTPHFSKNIFPARATWNIQTQLKSIVRQIISATKGSTVSFSPHTEMVNKLLRRMTHIHIYITARLGGQYGGIFSSRLAVLARAQRGTIQELRTDISPYCPTLRNAVIDLLYDLCEHLCHQYDICQS